MVENSSCFRHISNSLHYALLFLAFLFRFIVLLRIVFFVSFPRIFEDTFIFNLFSSFDCVRQVASNRLLACNKTKVSWTKLSHKNQKKPFEAQKYKRKSISVMISFHFMKFSTASCSGFQRGNCWLKCVDYSSWNV